ncbi:hypothetical protein BX070DRAFT_227497 [Coemansia spiralis]|nr:hypothetical protein BX070DRAFT_227497 [Coemansia spiralis]
MAANPENPVASSDGDQASNELFAFPVPPTGCHDSACLPEKDLGSEVRARRSVASMDSPPGTTNESIYPYQAWPEQENFCTNQFKRFSKSTTSLPIILIHFADDSLVAGDDGSMEAEALTAAGATDVFSGANYSTKHKKSSPTLRAAKSHQNLLTTNESPSFSQSMFSLASKGEQMPEIAGLLSPIDTNRSYESTIEKSSGTITLVSHAHAHSTAPGTDNHHEQPSFGIHNNMEEEHVYQPPPVMPKPRKQLSMAQIEARLSNRNSMFIADVLLSGVDSATDNVAAQPTDWIKKNKRKPEQLELDIPIDVTSHRTSRYLYNVPSGPFGSSMHGTLSKALQWPHRVSQSAPRRLCRTRSSVLDQHKIYDIYEEAIWHTSSKTISNLTTSRLRSLGSATSSAMPWNFIRTWRPHTTPKKEHGEWNDQAGVPADQSNNNNNGYDSASDSDSDQESCSTSVSFSLASQKEPQSSKPARKSSMIHLLVKRASLGLLRRSASFCKTVSGSQLTKENPNRAMPGTEGSYKHGISSADVNASDNSRRLKAGNRLVNAMRQASSKLRGPFKHFDKSYIYQQEEEADIVSAYPADSLPGKELDSYLSLSALHSPVLSSTDNTE